MKKSDRQQTDDSEGAPVSDVTIEREDVYLCEGTGWASERDELNGRTHRRFDLQHTRHLSCKKDDRKDHCQNI